MSNTTLSATDEFATRAAEVLAPGAITRDGASAFDVDGCTPELIVVPRTYEQAAAALGEAAHAGLAVIPWGGGAHMALGNVPAGYDIALSMRDLDAIEAYEPDDLTVTVQAGVRLATLQRILDEHGQSLPIDPPCADDATVGGVLATNASGPMRHARGTVRDWLIGVKVAHADGALTKAGGRVVKNVAGYEMTKLYIGSLGTLGIIVEATFKLAPLPIMRRSLVVLAHSARDACDIALRASDAGLACEAAEVLSPPAAQAVAGDARWCLLVRLSGGERTVERSMRELSSLAGAAHASAEDAPDGAWDTWRAAFAPAGLAMRAGVLPSHTAETVEILDRRFVGSRAVLSATPSAGVIRGLLDPTRGPSAATLAASAADAVIRRQGTFILEAAPLSVKRQTDVFGRLRPDFAIMQRLKEEFDPARTLSPGRFVGRL